MLGFGIIAHSIKHIARKPGKISMILVLIIQGYLLLHYTKPSISPEREQAADTIARKIVDTLGDQFGGLWNGKYVQVSRLIGDFGGHIRHRIEERLPDTTNCILSNESVITEFWEELIEKSKYLGLLSVSYAESLKIQPCFSSDDALNFGEKRNLNYVVFGKVNDFRHHDGQVHWNVNIKVLNMTNKTIAFEQEWENNPSRIIPANFIKFDPKMLQTEHTHWITWILMIVLIPICSASFWTMILRRESNGWNIACVLFLTFIDMVLAWVLMGFQSWSTIRRFVLILCFHIALIWNIFILNFIDRKRREKMYGGWATN